MAVVSTLESPKIDAMTEMKIPSDQPFKADSKRFAEIQVVRR